MSLTERLKMRSTQDKRIKRLGLDVAMGEWITVHVDGKQCRFRIDRKSGYKSYKVQFDAPLDFTFIRESASDKSLRARKGVGS